MEEDLQQPGLSGVQRPFIVHYVHPPELEEFRSWYISNRDNGWRQSIYFPER